MNAGWSRVRNHKIAAAKHLISYVDQPIVSRSGAVPGGNPMILAVAGNPPGGRVDPLEGQVDPLAQGVGDELKCRCE